MRRGAMRGNERGLVLLLVLVMVTLLSALLSEFSFSTLVDMRLTETFRDSTRSYYLARGGVRVGQIILQEDANGYDARNELWGQGVASYPVGDGTISIAIEDLDGKLPLNRIVSGANIDTIVFDRIERLLELLDFADPAQMTVDLADWIDTNDQPYDQHGLFGTEDAYYMSLERPYHCKNGPLVSLEELALVRGFDKEAVERLRDHVTVYGDPQININTASAEVIASLDKDLFPSDAEEIVALREGAPFESLQDLKDEIAPQVYNLLTYQVGYEIKVKSTIYRTLSQAWINDGTRTVVAVIDKSRNEILYNQVR